MLTREAKQGLENFKSLPEQSTGDASQPCSLQQRKRGGMRKKAKMKNLPLESNSFVPRPSLFFFPPRADPGRVLQITGQRMEGKRGFGLF